MNITTDTPRTSIFIGLDVHKDTINLAALAPDGSRFLLERVYKAEKLTQLRKDHEKLSKQGTLLCCYEASSAGFVLPSGGTEVWREMQEWGVN